MDLLQSLVLVVALGRRSSACHLGGLPLVVRQEARGAATRLKKSERAASSRNSRRCRRSKQIEALKKELDEQRKIVVETEGQLAQRTRELELALLAAEKVVPRTNSGMMPLAPTNGFADTQIMG